MNQAYALKIGGKDAAGNIEILADDPGECLVATVNGDNADPEIVQYDAKQIVKSWNCHDDLVEALRPFTEDRCENPRRERHPNPQYREHWLLYDCGECKTCKVRAAIAKAEKEDSPCEDSSAG